MDGRGEPPHTGRPRRVNVADHSDVAVELLEVYLRLNAGCRSIRPAEATVSDPDPSTRAGPAAPDGPLGLPGRIRVGVLEVQPEPGRSLDMAEQDRPCRGLTAIRQ